MLERQYFGCHLSKPWRYTSLEKGEEVSNECEIGRSELLTDEACPNDNDLSFLLRQILGGGEEASTDSSIRVGKRARQYRSGCRYHSGAL